MATPSHPSRRTPARPPSTGSGAWSMPAAVIRFVGWVLRGLIATTVLLALIAGLPYVLWRYIGWPLPNHVPAWAEVQGALFGPMTTTFLLDVLACLCWIIWAVFAFDVARCVIEVVGGGIDAIRYLEVPAAGPIRALAGVMVGAILLAVLGNRATAASVAASTTTLGTGAQVVAAAPAWHHPTRGGEVTVRTAVVARQASAGGSATVNAPARAVSVVVQAARNGVHDSLSRIAERTLGDAARWPEIFALNKGKPQPHGHTFTNPHLIYPGQELALPLKTIAPIQPPQNPSRPAAASPTTSPPSTPAMPMPSTPRAQSAVTDTNSRDPGFSWGSELFVGLGLAAAVSATLVLARRRYHARYRPGSGDRNDLPVAPVVYQLRLAHLRTDQGDEDEDADAKRPPRVPPPLLVGEPGTGASQRVALAPGLGVRDGREIALDLATARGLGLLGAGAPAAARALLVAALTATHHQTDAAGPGEASVVIPANDVAAVLGHAAAHRNLPAAVRVVDDLEAALDVLEGEILVRAATGQGEDAGPPPWPTLVLVARPPQQHRRLQAILDNGAPFGITGLLLGQWQPGVTCYVREDGTISATSPGLGEALRGTHMFRLGRNDTGELLMLLRQAEPHTSAENPGLSPVPPPRTGPARPATNQAPHHAPTGARPAGPSHPEPVFDTDLEILAPNGPPAPRARPRPVSRQRPATPKPGDAEDEPGTTGQHAATAARTRAVDGGPGRARVPITITVLGALRVHWQPKAAGEETREITGALQPRTKELLVLLALHPRGTTRDTLVSTLWGDTPPARPTNALHTALSRMRRDLATATSGEVSDITSVSNGHYQLDPAMVCADYWRFEKAVAARRAATTEQQRTDAYREVVNSYGGPLAEGMSKIEWIEPAREATRRDAIDAVAALARALVEQDPQQTLDLLEIARAFDPHNEALYRDIMRLQERLGQPDAIPRTLTLLTTRLAEINEAPSEHAIALAARLRQRHEASPDTPARRSERDTAPQRRPAAS